MALSQATDTIDSLRAPAMVQEVTVETQNPIGAAQGLQDENPERAMTRPDTVTCDKHNEVRTSPYESESETE